MAGEILLDTNVVIALFAGHRKVQSLIASSSNAFVSHVTIGELWYGAFKSSRPEKNARKIVDFAQLQSVLFPDSNTVEAYGRIKDGLRRKGRAIPDNDIWIAAIAAQYGLAVATNDRHFHEIESIQVLTIDTAARE